MARPKKDESEIVVTLSASVLPEIADEVVSTAANLERSKSWLAGKLLLRGWLAYKKDGKLADDEPKQAKRITSDIPLKLSRKSIRVALDGARAFTGEPLSKEDRENIERALLEESDSSTRRKGAKKS